MIMDALIEAILTKRNPTAVGLDTQLSHLPPSFLAAQGSADTLESAARVGGADLLKAVEAALAAPQADVATAAVRALCAWPDAAALPGLLRVAAKDPDTRRQTLATRGVAKLFNTQPVDIKALLPVWRARRAGL